MSYKTELITLTLTGTTGSQDSAHMACGRLVGVYLKYNGQTSPTTVLKTKGGTATAGQAPSLTLLSIASAATDGWFFPIVPTVKSADGTAVTTIFKDPPIDDYLTLAVTAGGAAGSILAWAVYAEDD